MRKVLLLSFACMVIAPAIRYALARYSHHLRKRWEQEEGLV